MASSHSNKNADVIGISDTLVPRMQWNHHTGLLLGQRGLLGTKLQDYLLWGEVGSREKSKRVAKQAYLMTVSRIGLWADTNRMDWELDAIAWGSWPWGGLREVLARLRDSWQREIWSVYLLTILFNWSKFWLGYYHQHCYFGGPTLDLTVNVLHMLCKL